MKKVRITAVRRTEYPDLMEKYENPIEHTCDVRIGQQWVSVDGKRPEGMCGAAWSSMREFVEALSRGEGNFYDGWMKNPMSAMISCNDGFRPLSYYIEVIPDPMETDRILLRPWLESDAGALFKYASDPEVGPRAGWPPHKSVEESLEIIRTVFNDATNTWAIVLKETEEPIGAMGYGPSCVCNLPAREGEPITGYWVARPYWNQGICTEALRLMLDHIRQTTSIKSLISGHFIDNPASGRVMEKCGFIPTGETVVDLEQGRDTPIRVLRLIIG